MFIDSKKENNLVKKYLNLKILIIILTGYDNIQAKLFVLKGLNFKKKLVGTHIFTINK